MNITTPWEVDLDGYRKEDRYGNLFYECMGTARRQLDGTYRVLAKVYTGLGESGMGLAVVEVRLTF